jgi:tetratricopeptide (TPR) repeat protein
MNSSEWTETFKPGVRYRTFRAMGIGNSLMFSREFPGDPAHVRVRHTVTLLSMIPTRAPGTGVALLALLLVLSGCASRRPAPPVPVAPRYPTLVQPAVPPDLVVPPLVRQRYDEGWRRLQTGDLRTATRDLEELLNISPAFYPADTALGQIALLERNPGQALDRFTAAVQKNSRYLPALEGRVEAALAAGDDVMSAQALEQLLAADPTREEARTRLGLVRLRIVQGQMAAASRARAAGHLDEAQAMMERALQVSPGSPVLLRELSGIELSRGALPAAEAHARRAVELDSADPESLAALGAVLDAAGQTAEAERAYSRAVNLDPRPAWRERRDALRARARLEALPAEYRAMPSATAVTRAQVAAAIGIDLESLVARAPKKSAVVVTDVRTSWAASWILPLTQAGIMEAFPNHTFQPNAPVRRSDLAQIAAELLMLAARPEDVARWRAARPRLEDVPAGHLAYRAVGLVVAAGVLPLDATGRFWPARQASGADVTAVIARVRQLTR